MSNEFNETKAKIKSRVKSHLPKDWITDSRCYDRDQWFSLPPFVQAGVPEETEWVVRGLDTLLAEHGYLRDGAYYRAEQPN